MSGAYRDGLGEAQRAFARARDRALQSAPALSRCDRSLLPRALRRELSELERELGRVPASVDEARSLEEQVRAYERALDAAAAITTGRRATYGTQWRARIVVAALALFAASPFVWMVHTSHAELTEWCAEHGRGKSPNWWHIFSWPAPACIAVDDSECAYDCAWLGACRAVDGECVATAGADCRESKICAARGACEIDLGECVVGDDQDCRDAEVCVESGRCVAGQDGEGRAACVAGSVLDCEESESCRARDHCHLLRDRCGTNEAWCALHDDCYQQGRCSYDDALGVCAALTDDDCKHSAGCFHEGRCTARNGSCRVVHNAYCQSSSACREEGRCVLRGGLCRGLASP